MAAQNPVDNQIQQTGTTLPLELELEEDIEKEIHHFVKLSRMRNYAEAHRYFDDTLRKHDKLFPVAAEYADMLLDQACYAQASDFLEHHIRETKSLVNTEELRVGDFSPSTGIRIKI